MTSVDGFDLEDALRQLATWNAGRSEADIQAMIRDLLVFGGFDLGGESVRLESPSHEGGRIDVAVGSLLIECKRDLRSSSLRNRAEQQLAEYMASAGKRASGILTDGTTWRLYRYRDAEIQFLDEKIINPLRVDERAFRWWIGSVLSTERELSPTTGTIEERLGARSPSFMLVRASLLDAWHRLCPKPQVALKRALWAKLLRSALGSQFEDTDELFVEHTYLVLMSTLIGHAVAGFHLDDYRHNPGVMLSGQLFESNGLIGIGEAGFFDWVVDDPMGIETVGDLARRLSSFTWDHVDHDILKVLYHSVIDREVRHGLGEYYTPDWLASRMIEQTIDAPLTQRVLDPACGSGTFLFHAIRRYLSAAEEAQLPVHLALSNITSSIFGIDLHPVAVSLAQTTYLLAIGRERLSQRVGTLAIPVYLGDSMRWDAADDTIFTAQGDIVIYTEEGLGQFATELRFPPGVVSEVRRFDQLVRELVSRATSRPPNGSRSKIGGLLANLAVAESDRPVLVATYAVLCDLHDQNRDHIWGYYIRNQCRPAWLGRIENRVDVIIGNPPWLAYRYMAQPLQRIFERRARERGIWRGGARGRSTQQDLSAFFVARSVELFLRVGGRFSFVMPRAVLSRQTYEGFRSGQWASTTEECFAAFGRSWDLGTSPGKTDSRLREWLSSDRLG